MTIGILDAHPVRARPDLVAAPVAAAVEAWPGTVSPDSMFVAEIDPQLADTQAFCERYGVALDRSAN
jgi:hypothetical protein